MSNGPYVKLPGARLYYPNGEPLQSIGCCPGKSALGNTGAIPSVVLLGGAALALLVLFPKVWKSATKELWG
jgi:hypothetical protein